MKDMLGSPPMRRRWARCDQRVVCWAAWMVVPLIGWGAGAVREPPWEETRSRHFLVRHHGAVAFAAKIAAEAERHYEAIARDLGYTRFGGYWLWSERVTIVLHPTPAAFAAATGAPEWARGKADYRARRIHAIAGDEGLSEAVLPHELAHLVFREFVGFEGDVPLWLDEGVAQRQEGGGVALARSRTRAWMSQGGLISLAELTRLRREDVGTRIPAHAFYVQAASVVGSLVDVHGSERFTKFCRQLRDGRSLEDALRFTYPEAVRTIRDLERGWKTYLEEGP